MNQIKNLPWVAIRDAGFICRRILASKERPDRKHLLVDAPIDELDVLFAENHYRSSWFISYHYHGEDKNLSRSEYHHGEFENLQHHIRLFDREDDRTELFSHVEVCPIEHPREHLNGAMHSVDEGIGMVRDQLDAKKITYEVINP